MRHGNTVYKFVTRIEELYDPTKATGLRIGIVWIAAMMVHSHKTAGEYVAPSDAVPRGRAAGMQVQILTHGEQTREYAVIFSKGDEAFSGMLDFAEKYHITSAHFTAIGVLNGTRLAWFDPQRKTYKKIPIDSQSK